MSRRVAVTGATGFIGRHLVASLAASGNRVVVVVRPESTREPPEGGIVVRAALETDSLRQAFKGVDAVVHLAGMIATTRDVEYTTVNVDGTRAVAEAATGAGARLIHISSLAAAGPAPASHPRTESDPSAPVTEYGRTKLKSEDVVRETAGLTWTILRPGVVYGPGDRAVLELFRYANRGVLPLVGRPDTSYTFIYVDDVVRTIEAALSAAADQKTWFVGHPQPATARQILEGVGAAVGRRAMIVPIPMAVTYVASFIGELVGRTIGHPLPIDRRRYVELTAEGFVCSVDRLRDELGVVAQVALSDGLKETAAWYRREGWL